MKILEFCKNFGQVKVKFGQVNGFLTCPNGQVRKKVNVEPCSKYAFHFHLSHLTLGDNYFNQLAFVVCQNAFM